MCASSGDEKEHTKGAGASSGRMPREIAMETRDQARIEQLKGSITKIEEQIENTRRELNAVCESLRIDKDFTAVSTPASSSNVTTHSPTKVTELSQQASPSKDFGNEQLIENARTMVSGHIKSLTKYNQLKDVAMGLFELIAEHKGVRLSEVLRDDGVALDD